MSQPDTLGSTVPGIGAASAGFPEGGPDARPAPRDAVTAAARARTAGWSADAAVDLGDQHDKGEASLCVGEAA